MAMWLSFAQLFLSGTIGFVYVQFRANSKNGGFFSYLGEARKKNDPAYKKIMLTSVFNAIGSTCVNMAYIQGSVSLVQIIKSLEPVTTYVLSAGILKIKCNIQLFFSILFVVIGSVVTCASDSSYNRNSFLLAFASNLMMPLRNVTIKSAADDSSRDRRLVNQQPTGFMMFSLISALGSSLVGAIAITTSLITGTAGSILADTMVWNKIIFSSGFFFAYNGSSFVVLQKLDPITHSILNICKRYFNILCNVALFSTDFTTQIATGLLISAVGLLMFTLVKMKVHVPLPSKARYYFYIPIFFLFFLQLHFDPSSYLDVKTETEVTLRMMVVPFDAYFIRNGIMEHRTCKKTIMVRGLHDWNNQPFTEYKGNIRDLPLEANKDLVCISVGSKTGAIILSHSIPNSEDHDITFLGSDATELVLEKLEHASKKSRINLQAEIVERTSVAIFGWYKPTSPEAVEARRKDDNSGNFIWQYGATRMINAYTTSFIDALLDEASEASVLVLASANAFYMNLENENPYNMMKGRVGMLTNIVRKIDKPTILLGIGIQAEFDLIEDINTMELHEHQAAFLKEIGVRNNATTSVSVRGDVTNTAAVNAGVTNTISLGCPSLSISRAQGLGAILEKGWKDAEASVRKNSSLKIGVALPAIRSHDPNYHRVVGNLLSICEPHDCYFIMQAGYDRGQLLKFGGGRVDKSKVLWFRDGVEDWFEFMQGLDFLVSTRIHGGMAGVAVGVPTMVLPTDFRIMELVNAMKLPHIPFEDFSSTNYTSLDQMMKAATKDFVEFEANRLNRLREYHRLLTSVGLEMDPALVEIFSKRIRPQKGSQSK